MAVMQETGVLLNYLPALYRTGENADLRALLSVLDAVLFGSSPSETPGIEDRIAGIPDLFDPHLAPEEFLPWLSEWVALSHSEQLPQDRWRRLIADIVPLYAQRGTKSYLARLFHYFLPEGLVVSIDDQAQRGLRLGHSKLGIESRLEGENPFWFALRVRHEKPVAGYLRDSLERTVRAVTDRAKPAHTSYDIYWE